MSGYTGPAQARRRSFGEWLDDVIGLFSPERALRRKAARMALSSYRGATVTRVGRQVNAISTSADYALEGGDERRKMVDRARQVERDNPIADGLLTRNVENVVHQGIHVQARTLDKGWNKAAEELWANEFVPFADARGLSDFYELQALAQRSLKRDGDVGAIKLGNGQLQMVESDQIAAPHGKRFQRRHVDGIDLDRRGRPVTFYIVDSEKLPDTVTPRRRDLAERTEISADDFIFLANRKRLGQTRGVTDFATTFEHFDQVEGLVEAVITAARMAACVGLMITSPNDPRPNMPTVTNTAGQTATRWAMEPAMVKYLQPGEDVRQLNPAQPATTFDGFMASVLRILGLPFGQPLELLMVDFSRTNYSSARAALLQAYRTFRQDQHRLIRGFCQPVWLWQVERWMDDGLLPRRDDWRKHEWVPPGWAWIDPVKEIQAEQMAIDAGFGTLQEFHRRQGREWLDWLEQRKSEISAQEEAGVPFTRSTLTRDPVANQVPAVSTSSGGEQEPGEVDADGEA